MIDDIVGWCTHAELDAQDPTDPRPGAQRHRSVGELSATERFGALEGEGVFRPVALIAHLREHRCLTINRRFQAPCGSGQESEADANGPRDESI